MRGAAVVMPRRARSACDTDATLSYGRRDTSGQNDVVARGAGGGAARAVKFFCGNKLSVRMDLTQPSRAAARPARAARYA